MCSNASTVSNLFLILKTPSKSINIKRLLHVHVFQTYKNIRTFLLCSKNTNGTISVSMQIFVEISLHCAILNIDFSSKENNFLKRYDFICETWK